MKKNELIDEVALRSGLPKTAVRDVLGAAVDVVKDAVSFGNPVFLFGLGKIEVRQRGTKKARNLHTGAVVFVQPRRVVAFRPSNALLAAANS